VGEEPVPSLLRGFSAPVKLEAGYTDDELALLLARDSDAFVRWDAGQTLALRALLRLIEARREGREGAAPPEPRLVDATAAVLDRAPEDRAFAARALQLPSGTYLGQQMPEIDVDGIAFALRATRAGLGRALRDRWLAAYEDNLAPGGEFSIDSDAIARRSLKNTALAYLAFAQDPDGQDLARRQLAATDTMTDSLAALRLVVETGLPERDEALAAFHARWQAEPLVVNKWFALQAMLEDEEAVERVERLMRHPAFTLTNPNRVRSVLGVFGTNLLGFHRRDGAGYRLLADKAVELDRLNPQVAARLLTAFGRWRRFDAGRQALMRAELERVVATPGLSRDSYEIASKSLA
jgi:aminopeptidase N